jgi:diaminohydroxyphosphoribosylaminopyrimidine deaminase/5-amino-6-(5-phosphoribosylamino)uracil reductase
MIPMQRALSLAREALGTTSPNPAVGAVVVADGRTVGEGYTLPPGQRHAEIGALEQAGTAARGATLYTTLEPCCNFGRTPPCTRAIIAAGIGRVHVGSIDPNPNVAGRGCAELEAAGIEVVVENDQEATELYRAFAKHISTGLPYVTAKFASSLDGKIATHTGDSKWVTGPEARRVVQHIRRASDAVMVGINTVLADDPQLTARDDEGNPLSRQPLRVILDARCRTPVTARLLREPGQTLIATTAEAPAGTPEALTLAGAEVFVVPSIAEGMVDLRALLSELGERGVVSLLVEGGGAVLGSLFDGEMVDEVWAFVAPLIIGGAGAASPVEGHGAVLMPQAWRLRDAQMQQIGPDWLIRGQPFRGE